MRIADSYSGDNRYAMAQTTSVGTRENIQCAPLFALRVGLRHPHDEPQRTLEHGQRAQITEAPVPGARFEIGAQLFDRALLRRRIDEPPRGLGASHGGIEEALGSRVKGL